MENKVTGFQDLRQFDNLTSESARLRAVKEQILIRVRGFGWDDAGHAWSKGEVTYSSMELYLWFVNHVLKLDEERGIPNEPPFKFQDNTTKYQLGTDSGLQVENPVNNAKTIHDIKTEAMIERERREMEGETDRNASLQTHEMPAVDENLVGFGIEYCFSYLDDDGSEYYGWCEGVVSRIVNAKKRMVEITWNEQKVHEDDVSVSRHQLKIRGWNGRKVGAWRKFVGDQI